MMRIAMLEMYRCIAKHGEREGAVDAVVDSMWPETRQKRGDVDRGAETKLTSNPGFRDDFTGDVTATYNLDRDFL